MLSWLHIELFETRLSGHHSTTGGGGVFTNYLFISPHVWNTLFFHTRSLSEAKYCLFLLTELDP